uniref:Predicted protein n=1 Tax=Hordeum vulgare subsp. vulgare TaxID=112509 RepID=F2EK74_HORVV|nr:predicted protein [Hordeum vulgare subsp. vulgare]
MTRQSFHSFHNSLMMYITVFCGLFRDQISPLHHLRVKVAACLFVSENFALHHVNLYEVNMMLWFNCRCPFCQVWLTLNPVQ